MGSPQPNPPGRERPADLLVFAVYNLTATIFFGISPIVVDLLVGEGRATLAEAGRIPTTDVIVMGLVSLAAPRFLSLDRIRLKGCIAALCCTVGNIVTLLLKGDAIIFARVIAGAGSGILFWLQFAYIARSKHAEQLTGGFFAFNVAFTIFALLFANSFVVPHFGANGMFVLIATVCVLTAGLSILGPRRLISLDLPPGSLATMAQESTARIPASAFLILANNFFAQCAIASAWVYLNEIGKLAGISASWRNFAVMVCLVMQVVGASIAAWLVSKISARASLVVIGLGLILCYLYTLSGHVGVIGFFIFTTIVGLSGFGICPFEVALLLKVDPSRRSIDYFSVPLVFGSGLGPLFFSLLVRGDDIKVSLVFGMVMGLVSLLCVIAALKGKPDDGSVKYPATELPQRPTSY